MTKIALCFAFVVPVLLYAANASGQAKGTWIDKEFTVTSDAPLDGVSSFLNDTCHTSGLDGIQLLAVQPGHGQPEHLHVYCRQDNASSARYKVTLPVIEKGKVFATVKEQVGKPNIRIGPFYFGTDMDHDSVVLLEKTM